MILIIILQIISLFMFMFSIHNEYSSHSPLSERGLWVLTECCVFGILKLHAGALGAEVPRQSIPNLAVKLYSGNNTVGAALWKDSSVPAANFI